MKLQPRPGRVLIRPRLPKAHTDSGLHLVEHRKPEQIGTILATAADVRDVQIGDTVLFSWQSGQEIQIKDAGRVLVMFERDVLAVVGRGVDVEANDPILA